MLGADSFAPASLPPKATRQGVNSQPVRSLANSARRLDDADFGPTSSRVGMTRFAPQDMVLIEPKQLGMEPEHAVVHRNEI